MTRADEPGREVLVVRDPMAEADYVPALEAIGLSNRCSRYSGSRAWIRLRDRPRSSRKDFDLHLATKPDLAMRTWRGRRMFHSHREATPTSDPRPFDAAAQRDRTRRSDPPARRPTRATAASTR